MKPAIAVITPTLNRLDLLNQALSSVCDQTFTNWEHIVVDDGSTDGTEQAVTARAAADPRLRYITRDRLPAGANACRNLGVAASRADLVIFLDSDDLLSPECLDQRIRLMNGDAALDLAVFPGWVFTGAIGDRGRLFSPSVIGDDLDRFLYLDYPWEITSPIWRKRAFERLGGFDESLPSWQDVDLHVRTLIAGLRYVKAGAPDHHIRWNSEPTKTSVRQFKAAGHLQSGESLVRSFHDRLATSGMLTLARRQALGGLHFLLAEAWIRQGEVAQAFSVWHQARRTRLASVVKHGAGILVLTAFRLKLLPPDYNERLLERFKIAAGFRFQQ